MQNGYITGGPALLCDCVELILLVLTERIPTDPRPPAPAEAPAPAQLLHKLLLGGQQEDHAAGHQDVPDGVCVVVVVLRLGENVQAHPDEGAERSGEQEEDPAPPGRGVAVSAADPSVHLETPQSFRAAWVTNVQQPLGPDAYPGDDHEQDGTQDGAQQVPQTLPVQLHGHGDQQGSEQKQSLQTGRQHKEGGTKQSRPDL